MRICAGTEHSSWKYLRCWTDCAPHEIQTVALDTFLRTFLTCTCTNYKVYFSRASGSGMRPVHRVVGIVTRCLEAWKRWLQRSVILTCWEHTSQKHQSSQEGTRKNQICKMFLWYHQQLNRSSNLTESWRNPGEILEGRLRPTVVSGLLGNQAAELQLYLHN